MLGSALGSCRCTPAGKRLPVCRAAWSSRLSRPPFAPSCLRSPPPAVCPSPSSPGVCAVPAVPNSPMERLHWGYFPCSASWNHQQLWLMVWNPPFLQCWQGGWHFPRYKGQEAEKWGEGERSCKTSPAVVCFFRHPPGCQHRPTRKKVEVLGGKWGLGLCRSWVCGVGEAVTHLSKEVLAPLGTLSLHPIPVIHPTMDLSCENSLNSNLFLSPCPTLRRLSPIRGMLWGAE